MAPTLIVVTHTAAAAMATTQRRACLDSLFSSIFPFILYGAPYSPDRLFTGGYSVTIGEASRRNRRDWATRTNRSTTFDEFPVTMTEHANFHRFVSNMLGNK
jgi:hypothetical protein